MALIESAIGGIAVTAIEQAIKAGGYVGNQIKKAYRDTQATQKAIAAAQNYERRYEQHQCQIKVMPGLMKEPLPLDEIYTAVKLLDDQSIRYFVSPDDLEETYRQKGQRSFSRDRGERQDGILVADREQYLMVLGGPGIGKSTFLRKIGLEALKPKQDPNKQIQRDCIPVLIELKEFREDTIDLVQKIAAEFDICGFPEAEAVTKTLLAQGKLLVLLDGLDEVPTRNLNAVIEYIEDFVDTYDKNTFVASCRTAAYRSSSSAFFRRFTDVTLAEFDDEQIEQFIHRWFRSQLDIEAGTADKYWELLQKDENKATKELAQTPLLLTFLCLVYDREQTLPTQRSTLYGTALNILLSEWAAQKRLEQDPIYEGFHPDLEKVLLAEIAYHSFEQDQLFFLKDDLTRRISQFLADTLNAPKYLDGAAVLQAIEKQQGILVERATDVYSFSHLTLQEYLVAFYIVEQRLEDELINQHLTDERWREVFLLVAGLSSNRAINILQRLENQTRNYLKDNPKLDNLLRWAEESTNSSEIAKRAGALAIAITSTNSTLTITITSTTLRLSNNMTAITTFDEAFGNTIGGAVTSAKNCGLTIALARAIANTIASNSAEAIAFMKSLDTVIVNAKLSAEAITNNYTHIFKSTKFAELPKQLQKFVNAVPTYDDPSEAWENWANELEALWLHALGFTKDDLTFTKEEAEAIQNYHYIIELLIRCKDAAVRIPKQAWIELEARLLMPLSSE